MDVKYFDARSRAIDLKQSKGYSLPIFHDAMNFRLFEATLDWAGR